MATTKNALLGKASGRVGRDVVLKQYGDKTVISKYPDMSQRVLSPKQLQMNEMMESANYEARRIVADEALRNEALIRLNVTRNKLYTTLISEYFKAARPAKKSRKKDR